MHIKPGEQDGATLNPALFRQSAQEVRTRRRRRRHRVHAELAGKKGNPEP